MVEKLSYTHSLVALVHPIFSMYFTQVLTFRYNSTHNTRFMKKRFLFYLGLALFAWPQFLSSQTISVGGSSLSFDDPITTNPSTAVGGFCVYNDVVTVGTTSYDAIISIDGMTNALI